MYKRIICQWNEGMHVVLLHVLAEKLHRNQIPCNNKMSNQQQKMPTF